MLQNISEVKSIEEGNQQLLKRNRRQTISSNNQSENPFNSFLEVMGNSLSGHLKNLRRTNLINLLSQKQPEERNDKQNKMIMEMLKGEPFFQTIINNYKYFYQISSKIGYIFYKKDETIYKIHEFTEGYFILIKGQVQLTIPQKIDLPESAGKLNIDTFLTSQQNNLNNSKDSSKFDCHKMQNHKIQNKNNQSQNKNRQKNQDNNHKSEDKKQKPLKISKRQSKISVRLSRSSSFISNDRANSANQKQDQNSNKKSQKQSKDGFRVTSQFQSDIDQKDELQKQINQQQGQIICENKVVKIVQEGQCFGQITIGEVNKRATNAIAKQDCHLIVIRKQQYQLLSKASLITEMKILHNFLMKLPLLRKVYRYSLEGFLYYMQQLKFTYKSMLYKQDSKIEFIYIIKQGQFTQFKSMKQHHGSISKLGKRQPINNSGVIKQPESNQYKQNNCNWREASFKNIYQGEILGDCQSYVKKQNYMESCKCISQVGIVYKIQKKFFLQKLLSPQNQVPQIKKYLNQKFRNKTIFIQNFMKQQQNQLIQRYLPPSRSYHSSLKKRSQIYSKTCGNQYTSSEIPISNEPNNFFEKFNKTIYKNLNKNRLSVHKHKNRSFSQLSNKKDNCNINKISHEKIQSKIKKHNIPSNIKDIVDIVNQKQKYQNVRSQSVKQPVKIFQFDMQKIPRFIQQKYSHLLNKIKQK